MRRLVLLAAGFAYLVLVIEAVRAAVAWWETGGMPAPLDAALIAALPLLAWVWWRHLSVFRAGCAKGACDAPREPSGR